MLNQKDVQELLDLKPSDITRSLMLSYFANTKKSNARFKPNDKFILPKGTMGVKENTTTTVGRYIFNKFIIEPNFMDLLGYRNYTFTGKELEKMEAELAQALMDDNTTTEHYIDYLNRVQWFGFSFTEIVSPSLSYKTMVPLESVNKRRDELLKEYEEDINNGNAAIAGAKMEEELIKLAKEELKGDHGMDLYDSGARGKFDNHYKNQSIMRGPIVDNATGKFKVATSNYYDGIKKEEYNMFADMITDGAYNRAVGTQQGGLKTEVHYKFL